MTDTRTSRLLVVASLTPTCTANYLVHAFKELGCEVQTCSDVASKLADIRASGAVDVSQVIARNGFRPDYVLFIEGGSMQLLPIGLENVGCLTAWYGIDTHMNYARHLRIARLFDVSFIAQKQYVDRLRTDGVRQVYWLPLGFAQELLPSFMPERTIDIAYVGSDKKTANPERHALLEFLRHEFHSTWFDSASPQEMGHIYSAAKLVFNKSVKNDINMRYFEAAGAGAVLVTDRVVDNGVEELFDEGRHYVVYQDQDSLVRVIKDLLADPARCAAVGENARQHVLKNHTYRRRAETLLMILGKSKKCSSPSLEDYFPLCISFDLMSEALRMAARAMGMPTSGVYRRFAGALLFFSLSALASVFSLVERARFKYSNSNSN